MASFDLKSVLLFHIFKIIMEINFDSDIFENQKILEDI